MKLYIAAAICFVIAGGHTFLGHRWILVPLRQDRLPKRLYGGKGMTAITVTFDFVTFAVVGMGVLVLGIAGHPSSAERSLVLRTVAAVFAAVALEILWLGRRRPAGLLRTPQWVLFSAVSILCWVGG